MTATQGDRLITRRGVMRATAVGIGASATVAVGVSHPRGFVGDSEAALPVVAAVIGGVVVTDWALREAGVRGADVPAEGLTAGALQQQIYQTATARKSTNASTIVDNGNILDGVKHTSYIEGKIAAIEQLNAGATESEVLSAATDAVDNYQTTVKKNLLKSWNESLRELDGLLSLVQSHPDLNLLPDMLPTSRDSGTVYGQNTTVGDIGSIGSIESDLTLPDGTSFTLLTFEITVQGHESESLSFDPTQQNGGGSGWEVPVDEFTWTTASGNVTYLSYSEWSAIYSSMESTFSEVSDGISLWVSEVYGAVQSGDIEISDLVTPRERAAMMAEDEGTSQAIADLIALNVPVDLEREATITIDDTGATLRGTFGLTDSSDGPIETGTTYDPSTFSGDVFFTADMSLLEGDWTAIQTSVDGGTITITAEPYESTAIEVTTTADETVSVPAGDWSAVDGSEEWTYDASDGLETPITEVDSARFVSTATETQYETLNLDGQFTVDKLTNTESGEDVDSTSFSSSEPQDDTNYITQEEWDDLEQQNQELIQKFEESQNDGGGGGGGGGGFLPEDQNWGLIAAGAGAAAVGWGYLTGGDQ